MFRLPTGVAFNTEVEKNFLQDDIRHPRASAEETVGCGVDLMQGEATVRRVDAEPRRTTEERRRGA